MHDSSALDEAPPLWQPSPERKPRAVVTAFAAWLVVAWFVRFAPPFCHRDGQPG